MGLQNASQSTETVLRVYWVPLSSLEIGRSQKPEDRRARRLLNANGVAPVCRDPAAGVLDFVALRLDTAGVLRPARLAVAGVPTRLPVPDGPPGVCLLRRVRETWWVGW